MNQAKNKILVIDDDPTALELMEAMLVPNGYDVMTAGDGQKGITTAQINKPNLILLDIMMPGMDGYATLSNIKQNTSISKIPVVMLSAVGFDLNKELATQFGAAGYVTKPVNLPDLLKTIKSCLVC